MPGPPPKRADQRRRANTPAAGEPTQAPGAAAVPVPDADPEWHSIARRWFESLAESGQSAFYEPSDWAAAAVVAESMSRELNPQPVINKDGEVAMVSMPPKAASVTAWLRSWSVLLVTEGDRRRSALELQRAGTGTATDEGGEGVAWLADARDRLRSSG